MYVRGSRKDYDTWEALGNKGWGWNSLLPYFRKHQKLDLPEHKSADPQFMPHAAADKITAQMDPSIPASTTSTCRWRRTS